MRDIKFRAYDKVNEVYITDELILYNGCWFDGFKALEDYCALDVDSGNVVIQQFTGLYDKNGKEIYEGDLLELYLNDFADFDKKQIFRISNFIEDICYIENIIEFIRANHSETEDYVVKIND